MIIGVLFGQALLVGIVAQLYFKRVGLVWGLISLGLGFLFSIFLDQAITSNPRFVLDPEYRASFQTKGHDIAFTLMTSVPAFFLSLLAIATLPKRDLPPVTPSNHTRWDREPRF